MACKVVSSCSVLSDVAVIEARLLASSESRSLSALELTMQNSDVK